MHIYAKCDDQTVLISASVDELNAITGAQFKDTLKITHGMEINVRALRDARRLHEHFTGIGNIIASAVKRARKPKQQTTPIPTRKAA